MIATKSSSFSVFESFYQHRLLCTLGAEKAPKDSPEDSLYHARQIGVAGRRITVALLNKAT